MTEKNQDTRETEIQAVNATNEDFDLCLGIGCLAPMTPVISGKNPPTTNGKVNEKPYF